MDAGQLAPHVARLFPYRGPRRTRVAVEQELLVADAETGAAVPVEAVRAAARGASYVGHLGFEPGGQVELSLPCAAGPAELAARLSAEVAALRADCAAAGIELLAVPVDERTDAVPLQLTSPRYVAMQRHFDTLGPAGRRMMRRTASTQICLDWWPGRVGLEQWRVLNLAAPFLAAAFARSSGPRGRLTTWLAVDPERTGFDDRLLHGDDPVTAYAGFAAGATVFTTPGDAEEHLTTLFPPVRPRGRYLETRFLDAQEERDIGGIVAVFAALLYDDDRRRQALRILEPEQAALAGHWVAAAAGDQETIDRGCELADLTGLETAA